MVLSCRHVPHAEPRRTRPAQPGAVTRRAARWTPRVLEMMTEAGDNRQASSFEQACVEAKRLADAAVQANTKLLQASKELAKAADDGDIAKLHKASDKLASAMVAARQDVSNATTCWPLSAEDEERLLRERFEDELIALAASEHLTIRRHEQRLVVFPSVIRVLPAQRAVQIDRKKVTALRPSKLVRTLKAERPRSLGSHRRDSSKPCTAPTDSSSAPRAAAPRSPACTTRSRSYPTHGVITA